MGWAKRFWFLALIGCFVIIIIIIIIINFNICKETGVQLDKKR